MDEGKTKLIEAFKNSLKVANEWQLNREKCQFNPPRFDINIKDKLQGYRKFVDWDGKNKIGVRFEKQYGYSIKQDETIHISPVRVEFQVSWSRWKYTGKSWFKRKKRKEEEMIAYMNQHGLNGATLCWGCGYDYCAREKVAQTKTFYAIFFGNYIRELTLEEYEELCNLYINRICEIDTEKLNRKL
jgi:hypothetical protein